MNREIKFRGKRVDNGEWVTGDLIHGQGSKYGRMYILPQSHIYPKGCNELDGWDVIPETVGQYTGLKDKNRVEIFEGDLLGREIDDIKHVTYEIIYNDCGLVAKSLIPGSPFFFPIDKVIDRYPVLGNIHDNLELVK